MSLILPPTLPAPDGFYDELLAAPTALSEAQSHELNARLLLILANHIGDRDVLTEALAAAK